MLKSHPRGFTLIELVMTMIIVSIVSIPLSLLIGAHIESVFLSERDVMAENLACHEMEKVNNMTYANIATASFSNYEGYAYDLTRTVTYVQGDGASVESLKKIQVEVKKAGETNVITRSVTYLAKNVAYGI
ncbi:MAG: hypothetical protein A3D87_07255 [Omnitrophica WOR_2 bacterium RIFCSPHIGHO2_02_FULL_50_17]|nr:MAG: hypothetical protein A3D87_07255 [Omnitrophica WOR_2 bacterium RIFCSPHIGHO2_02_FULL_50_17]